MKMNYMQRWVKERLKESFEKNILEVFDSAYDRVYESGYRDGSNDNNSDYNKGLGDAWECLKRIMRLIPKKDLKLVDNTIYHMLIDDKGTSILVGNESTIDKLLDLAGKNVWIPIEDDLPEEDELVMVTMEKDGHRMTTTAVYYPSSLFWHDYVTAWMPYIEPYKGEDDECNN